MLLILISNFIFSQELIIVVAPFDVMAGSGFSKNDAETIEYLLLNELSKSKTIKVLDQSETMFKETIKRMEFELSDWSNPKKVAEFGKAVNANAVLLGRIMTLGDNEIIIAVRINDLTTEIKAANDMVVTKVSEVRGKLPAFTKEIVDKLSKPPPPPIKTYKIGDIGPAGGIVFYDLGFKGDGWRYLEAAPVGAEFTAEWGTYDKNVANTMKSVGSGKQNTKLIVEQLKALGETNKAAQLCTALVINGYKDWFLPSKDELNLMYINLKKKGLGGFSEEEYWSSSQEDNCNAWTQLFYSTRSSDGSQGTNPKEDFPVMVRAVRAF
jgi:TolB-like protein